MEIDENGVVNPLRPPAVVRDGLVSIRALPPVAFAFLALAGFVFVAGLVEDRPVSPRLIGECAMALLPAALLWRRPDAAALTPTLFRGAVLLAVAEIGSAAVSLVRFIVPATDVFADPPTIDVGRFATGVAFALVTVAGWWLVASAAASLRPAGGRWARVAAAIAAACAVATGLLFVLINGGYVGLGSIQTQDLANGVLLGLTIVTWLVAAFVAWVLISRAGGRPRLATVSAAVGAGVQTVASLPSLGIALVIISTQSEDWMAVQSVGITFQAVAALASSVLFAFAFATGLGDPPAEPAAA